MEISTGLVEGSLASLIIWEVRVEGSGLVSPLAEGFLWIDGADKEG